MPDHTHEPETTFDRRLFSKVLYPRFAKAAREHGDDEHRAELLAGLSGRVIEVGAGDGANFAHYPPTVTEVVAVEPENHLRAIAEKKAADAAVAVRVVGGVADHLPGDPDSFDAAVASLVLCSVPDQPAALAEIRRVLRPGGELRFYEHVRGEGRVLVGLQSAITPIWSRLGGGCHLNRDTESAIGRAGFAIEEINRFEFASGQVDKLGGPHILGRAVRPQLEDGA